MTFGITGNLRKPELPAVVQRLVERFRRTRTPFVLHDDLKRTLRQALERSVLTGVRWVTERQLPTACDMVVSLGGDGTILRLARSVGARQTPILGINIGKLGFLAEVSLEDLDDCFDEIGRGEYRVEDRMMLKAESRSLQQPYVALNDIVLDLASSSRMVTIETWVDEEYLSAFTGDGLIISTPTGSTGYALSNGGPIVPPTTETIVISPICPHTLTIRPVIVPATSTITLRVASAPGKVHLTADGQPESFMRAPIEVRVRRAEFATRLVKRLNTSYFEVLRRKLHWGRDARQEG